ncbi:MAG: excinuclease ABC subunit UvrC [Candidatus Nanopelagicaceae bacterium]|nr:excinuclease ABC subunit UvrC [Candidatus Nanopelagicaceae bacterium]
MANPESYRPRDVPALPGVYRFFDDDDQVIYVGKALSLKSRLSNYFQNNLPERTYRMVHEAVRVDWTIVDSEVEALQLEFSWIKQYNPTYNVQFRDDKSYPYLALSVGDDFPRVFITRKQKRSGIRYFGPFTQAWALRNTFDVVLKVFPVRSCTDGIFQKAQKSQRQCLLGDIGKCSAPCVGWISPSEHKELANRLVNFMDAGQGEMLPTLRKEMETAAHNQEYERAAKIRDQITSMEHVLESADAVLPENLFADVIAIHREGAHAAGSLFMIRGGAIKGSRSWLLDQKRSLEDEDDISALFASIYGDSQPSIVGGDVPPEILINELPANTSTLQEWLTGLRGSKVEIKVPQRGEKVEILGTVARNARYALIQFVNKRSSDSAISGKALVEIQNALDLDRPPLRIECFDISNISGTTVVASMVVFEDGLPKKSEYRRFIIDTDTAWDDTRAIHQVISRRIKRLLDERGVDINEVQASGGKAGKFSYPPSLIVVDGGAPQVQAALRALDEAGLADIPLCGLAKRMEEVWLPGSKDPMILPRTSEGLYLLQRVRDEAHRFAITFHRSRRSAVMLESLLDEIPNLGQVRRGALLKNFGSVAAIRKASTEEIAQVPGIGPTIANIIYIHLKKGVEASFDAQTGEILAGS